MANHYKVRANALATLGFSSYRRYLASPLWADIKAERMRQAGGKCQLCQTGVAYTVHHITYTAAVLAGKDHTQLLAVCRGCHRSIEFRWGVKRTDAGAIARAARGRSGRKCPTPETKALRKAIRPKCRCCMRPSNNIGRDGICLGCYKRHREKVHSIADENQAALIQEHGV